MSNGAIWPAEPECCQRWFDKLEPHDRTEGTKNERHTCPTCKRGYRVRFKCVVVGDVISTNVLKSELAETRRLPGR